jgi:dipeptidyl aminopeptidase/acylaminoacyl peptidase
MDPMRRHVRAAASLLFGSIAGFGIAGRLVVVHADEAKPAAAKKEPWTAEDIVYSEMAGQYRISPDAKWLVWVKSAVDKDKDTRVSNLFLSSLTETREIQLTRGSDTNWQPCWSPDGEKIAFLSNRPRPKAKPDTAPMQVWVMDAHGGEPWPLTELAHGPEHLNWLDKDTIIYSAEEDPALYEQELKKKKDDSEIVDDAEHRPPVRLYKISVKDAKITRLTANTDWIERWHVSKDGKYVAAIHAKSLHYVFDQKVPPVSILHNLTDGTEKQIFTEGRIRPYDFEWSTDNSGFYAWAPFSNDPKFITASIILLYYHDLKSGNSVQVPLDWQNGIGSDLAATPDGFVVGLAAGHRFETARYTHEGSGDGAGWKRTALEGDQAKNIQNFEVSTDGKTIMYSYSTASKMPQLYRAQLDGTKIVSPVQLTKLNDGLVNARVFAKSEVVSWKGSNEETVEGILYYPTNYEEGKRYPLITAIHGGPLAADHDLWQESWAYPIQLFTERGAFVLRPNYHGSSSYGLKWAESICCGKYYDLETPDINAGVDFLIGKGLVDADRVATMGWSNGSILSTSLITTYPDRYKVASVGAGDIEWISDWGNVMFGESFDAYYFGKNPMQDPQLYISKSPFFKMDQVKAPVLIFHGTADTNVPPAQSWSYFRVLQYYGKVPVKFVVFPSEPHGPRKLTHQMRKVDEEVAWFDKYFFKTTKPADETVKEGSPLEAALRAKNIARTAGNYGTSFVVAKAKSKPVLVPEVVQRGDLQIGRFEVTRAQFEEFDKNYKLEPGTQNYPASGITFDQAKSYVAWLSQTTGQTWRIPNESEVSALYAKKDGENTLDYWAGYAVNPDDAVRLHKKLAELPENVSLLKPVGSFAGQGKESEELIFDLGGNVAEWVLTPGSKGKAIGGSADQPADPRAPHEPGANYIGFRVVQGAAKPAPQTH